TPEIHRDASPAPRRRRRAADRPPDGPGRRADAPPVLLPHRRHRPADDRPRPGRPPPPARPPRPPRRRRRRPPPRRPPGAGAARPPLSSGQRGLLGIQMITTDNGVRIERVTLGMPAARAGVRPGDIVTKVGTVEVPTQEKLSEVLSGFRPGETVTLALRRAG